MADDTRFRTKRLTRGKDRWSKRRFRQPKVGKRVRSFIDSNTSGANDVELGESRTRDGQIVWSKPVKADTAKGRFTTWMDKADGSDVIHIRVGGKTLGVMAVFVGRYVPGVDNDPNIVAFWEYIQKRTAGRAENWGIFSCRSIAGLNPPVWSGHAWKKAIDISGPRLVMALVARLAVKYHARFHLVTVIYRGKIASTGSNWRWVPYGGSCPHDRHVHTNTAYDSSKRPPCAK
jgi:hypothetical protein